MAEMTGGSGKALSDEGKRSKSEMWEPNKEGGEPVAGLGLTRSASAGTPKAEADLNRKGSRKS